MDIVIRTSICIISAVAFANSSEVKLSVGGDTVEINGVTATYPFGNINFTISKYLGIPFAKPPVGKLRFRKPEPVDEMMSPYNAVDPPMACVQFSSDDSADDLPQSEDCLYLNVYVPGIPADSISGHAVAVWVHGGAFTQGTGSQYDATFLSLYGNVIVVTINYRLGVYGFLSTEDENAPGNYAFWDQRMAFQWVHDHIKDFGGDQERVTLFGQSAGAISISYQALFPQNRGLFHRIIAQSGSVFCPIYVRLDSNALADSQHLGKALGCETTPVKELIVCLRSKSNSDITQAIKGASFESIEYGLVLDNDLITYEVSDLISSSDLHQSEGVEFYRSLDVINGFNSHDGYFVVNRFSSNLPKDMLISGEQMKALISNCLHVLTGKPVHPVVIDMLMAEYTDWENLHSPTAVRDQFIKLLTDFLFGSPAVESARFHTSSHSAKNYLYYFEADPPISPLGTPDWLSGANHGDELLFVFGIETYLPKANPLTSWEIQLSRTMLTYWTTFIKTGNPNSGNPLTPMWPEFDMESQKYLKLEENTTDESVGQNLYAKENNFWSHVFPDVNRALDDKNCNKMSCKSSARCLMPSVVVLLAVFISLLFYSN